MEDVTAWLNQEDFPSTKIGPVLAWGAKKGARRWHREEDTLIAGPRPATPAAAALSGRVPGEVPDLEDAQNQPTLKNQFRALMQSVGIEQNHARSAANFCFGSFEMEDPAQIWQALRECLQIGQSGMKKQIWRLWTKHIHVDPPEALTQEIVNWGRVTPPPSAPGGRRFFAIDGQVVPTTPDDPEGMSMADAHRLASLQKGDRPRDEQTGGGLVTTLLQQQGETDRKRLELDGQRNRPEGDSVTAAVINQFGEVLKTSLNKPPDTSFETRIDAQRREFEGRMESQNQRFMDLMEAQGERHQHMLELVQTNNTHSLELVRLAMDGNNNRPSFFEQLEQALSNKVLADFLKPPAAPLQMITGPNGTMTLDVYKAIQEMNFKSEALTVAKTSLPELFKVGSDIAAATKELARTRGETVERDSPQSAQADETQTHSGYNQHTDCGHCGQSMTYPTGAEFLICPHCRAPQTADGHLMVPQGAPAEPDQDFDAPELGPEPVYSEAVDLKVQEEAEMVPQAPPAEFGQVFEEEPEMSPLLFGSYFLEPAGGPTPDPPGRTQDLEEPTPELAPVPAAVD